MDDELQPEVVEECTKYGEVVKVVIYEVSCTCWNSYQVIGHCKETPVS